MKGPIRFMIEMGKLKESSKHAVVDGGEPNLDLLKKHLHVERVVETNLRRIITKSCKSLKPQLILVCGNVGDGKSHILSHLNGNIRGIMDHFEIHNDATESFNPDESFVHTLLKVLDGFSDDKIEESSDKVILAINLGTLNNFLDEQKEKFSILHDYVVKKGILDADHIEDDDYDPESNFQYVNFTDYQLYSLTKNGPESKILSELLEKLTSRSPENFLQKHFMDFGKVFNSMGCPICYNFEFLMEQRNRDAVVQLMIAAIIKSKEIISLRSILNFIYDIIIPVDYQIEDADELREYLKTQSRKQYIQNILPNYLFEHPDLSKLFAKISYEDPCNFRSVEADDNIISVVNTKDLKPLLSKKINSLLLKDKLSEKMDHLRMGEEKTASEKEKNKKLLTRTFLRLVFFNNMILSKHKDLYYEKFTRLLFHYNRNDKNSLEELYEIVIDACKNWNGKPEKEERIIVDIGIKQSRYRILVPFKPRPKLPERKVISIARLDKFNPQIVVFFKGEGGDIVLHIDYGLLKLLMKVKKGYRPNNLDKQNYVNFINFLNKLIESGDIDASLEVDEVNIGGNVDFSLSYDEEFDKYKFLTH